MARGTVKWSSDQKSKDLFVYHTAIKGEVVKVSGKCAGGQQM